MSLTMRERVVQELLEIQKRSGYVSEGELSTLSKRSGVGVVELRGIAGFYPRLRTQPSGVHMVSVCTGTACHVKGAGALHDAFRAWLKIPQGSDTDPDGVFTVNTVACLGCCMIAPAVQIDRIIYGTLSPQDVPSVLADFLETREAAGANLLGSLTARPGRSPTRARAGEVRICLCSSCSAAGSQRVWEAFRAFDRGFILKSVGCTGVSYEAPSVEVVTTAGASYRYGRILPQQARLIVERHFGVRGVGGRIAEIPRGLAHRLLSEPALRAVTRHLIPETGESADAYWTMQKRIVTEGFGSLHPLDIDEYEGSGGLGGLRRAERMSAEEIIAVVEASGLRGRGGGGFPTAEKWRAVRRAGGGAAVNESGGGPRYIVCNGDEGDPGAFMDRMLLESFPFRVIEGMAIAARAVGAAEGWLYIRAEYPVALDRIEEALATMRERGVIGRRGDGGGLELSVARGAGAFVCGEETGLIEALQGRRGSPRYRPPYPSESGFRGRPTLVNNVETFALLPWILREGAARFAALGTPRSHGTKTFALSGKVRRGGLIEVEMGTTLRRVIEEIGGGAEESVKAVQVGGPSGGCVPKSLLDTPVDFEALREAGAFMGSGGMVVLGGNDCMVDIARYFLEFTRSESCGTCAWCRVGTTRMAEILTRICGGMGKEGDIEKLEELCALTARGSLCGLGRSAPNPVLSTLRHFRSEYEEHLKGRCPAKKCAALIRYRITEACIGCSRCHQVCAAKAIPFTPLERPEIDTEKCTKCGLCARVCPSGAVEVVT